MYSSQAPTGHQLHLLLEVQNKTKNNQLQLTMMIFSGFCHIMTKPFNKFPTSWLKHYAKRKRHICFHAPKSFCHANYCIVSPSRCWRKVKTKRAAFVVAISSLSSKTNVVRKDKLLQQRLIQTQFPHLNWSWNLSRTKVDGQHFCHSFWSKFILHWKSVLITNNCFIYQ